MTTPPDPRQKSRSTTLLVLRIVLWLIWAGLLLGASCFMAVMALIFSQPSTSSAPPPDPHALHLLSLIALLYAICSMVFVHTVRVFVFRALLRRQSWRATAIVYPIGKVVTWFACDGAAFFNLVICLIARSFLPSLPVALGALLVIALDPPLFRPLARWRNQPS